MAQVVAPWRMLDVWCVETVAPWTVLGWLNIRTVLRLEKLYFGMLVPELWKDLFGNWVAVLEMAVMSHLCSTDCILGLVFGYSRAVVLVY